ncbi:Membrane protein of unknown function [compost metagenome]
MFRNIINLLVTIGIFWAGMTYYPEHVHIQDNKTLILAALMMFVIGYLFSWLMLISFGLIAVGIGCLTTIAMVIVGLFLTPVKLWLLSNYLPGFEINGIWTYVILTVILSIFSIKARSNTTSTATTQRKYLKNSLQTPSIML